MAVTDTTRAHTSPIAIIGHTFARLTGSFAGWNDARATRKALSQLSDRELNDIGINRADIDNIVHKN